MKKTFGKKLSEFDVHQEKINQKNMFYAAIDSTKSLKSQQRFVIFSKAAEYFAIAIISIVLANAKISGAISPFSIGFCFALSQLGYNPLFVGPVCIISQIIQNPTLTTLTTTLCVFAVLLFIKGVTLAAKKPLPIYLYPAFQLLALVGYIYYHISTPTQIVQTIIYIVLSIMFTYIAHTFLRAIKSRGVIASLTLDENICFAMLCMSFSLGLSSVYVWQFSLSTITTCFIMLCTNKALGAKYTLYFAALSGFGIAFGNGSLIPLSIFCAWAVALSAHGKTKLISVAGVCLMDFVLGVYFSAYPVYTYINFLNLLLPSVVFMLIPNKIFEGLTKKMTISSYANGALLANMNRVILQKKLENTSKLLENMGENYQKIVLCQTKTSKPEILISNETINRTCKNCENYTRCFREQNMEQNIISLSKSSLEKSKATLLDLPQQLILHCSKTTTLLSSVNHAIANYKETKKIFEAEDESKIAVANQLIGTSRMLTQLAEKMHAEEDADEGMATAIYEELLSNDIATKDLKVTKGEDLSITLISRANESEEKIAKIISKMLKIEFKAERSISKYSGYKLLQLTPKPKYDVSIGVASSKKETTGQNGDNYTVINLDKNKVLISICDGMGSGNEASIISEKILELVENFYMAGFESDLILKNIANLISTSEKEIYATLDICIFDKSTGNTDFLKSSAPPSAHKTKEETNLIRGESLPIGIVESKADSSMKILSKGDVVVLASDGVVDAFASDEEYAEYINNSQIINMSLFSENLLQEAAKRTMQEGKNKDDMTILALRVI